MGAARLLRGEAEHGGSQRGEHHRRVVFRCHRLVEGSIHRFQILPHGGDGLAVRVTAQSGDEMRVRDAEAEDESASGQLRHRLADGVHGHRVARVDVGDPGGENELLRSRREVAEKRERIAADGLRNPQRRVAERLDPAGERRRFGRRVRVEEGPYSQASELHTIQPPPHR